jgi:phosphoglycerate kinase
LSNTGYTITCPNEDVPEGWALYDIGPKSIEEFDEVITRSDIIFWNGPVGVFEIEAFKNGSENMLRNVVKRTREGAISIMGGGDTANLVNRFSMQKDVTYISTGGGASL